MVLGFPHLHIHIYIRLCAQCWEIDDEIVFVIIIMYVCMYKCELCL